MLKFRTRLPGNLDGLGYRKDGRWFVTGLIRIQKKMFGDDEGTRLN